MDFLLHFHVESSEQESLVSLIADYAGLQALRTKKRTDDLLDNILTDTDAAPNYFVVNQSSNAWQSVQCNSYKKLHELGKLVSASLQSTFVQTLYCFAREYSYLMVYYNGKLIREIEGTNERNIPFINRGIVMPFESKRKDGIRINWIRKFDLDSIADFCIYLGIDISHLWDQAYSYVLKKDDIQDTFLNLRRKRLQLLWEIERFATTKLRIDNKEINI